MYDRDFLNKTPISLQQKRILSHRKIKWPKCITIMRNLNSIFFLERNFVIAPLYENCSGLRLLRPEPQPPSVSKTQVTNPSILNILKLILDCRGKEIIPYILWQVWVYRNHFVFIGNSIQNRKLPFKLA